MNMRIIEEISNVIAELDKELFRLNARKEKLDESNEKLVNYIDSLEAGEDIVSATTEVIK